MRGRAQKFCPALMSRNQSFKHFEIDIAQMDTMPFRLRMGPEMVLLGEDAAEGHTMLFRGCWSQHNEEPPFWWDLDAEEPIDWRLIGWAMLPSDDERAALSVTAVDARRVRPSTPTA
jgi:hypothetical protein